MIAVLSKSISWLIRILLLAVIQGFYDWIGWSCIVQENPMHKWAVPVKVIKELLDFVVTPYVCLHWNLVSIEPLILFYLFKWAHGCDSFYNLFDYMINKIPSKWGEWRWWTPVGLLRCRFCGDAVIPGYSEIEYNFKSGVFGDYKLPDGSLNVVFSKGMVNLKEATLTSIIGLIVITIYILIRTQFI